MSNYILVMDPMYGPHLEHKFHKYLKRYWKNGHWNYIYPNVTGQIKDKKTIYYNTQIIRAQENRRGASLVGTKLTNEYGSNPTEQQRKNSMTIQRWGNAQARKVNELKAEKARYTRNKYKDEIKQWESTPLSKIQTAVHKGLDWISKLFKKKG